MNQVLFNKLAHLYQRMEAAYDTSAAEAGLTCNGCQTNCCTSYFQHHTHIEWLYLWKGIRTLPADRRIKVLERARECVTAINMALSMRVLPSVMCPLNEEGRCILYPYRLMICRMHGTRNTMTQPDGTVRTFSGCKRFTGMFPSGGQTAIPTLDRTPFYQELAQIEIELLRQAKKPPARVNLTLAEMLASGTPKL